MQILILVVDEVVLVELVIVFDRDFDFMAGKIDVFYTGVKRLVICHNVFEVK